MTRVGVLRTINEFIELLEREHGCEVQSLPLVPRLVYIERIHDGQRLTYALQVEEREEMISAALTRSICARLKLDPDRFGC